MLYEAQKVLANTRCERTATKTASVPNRLQLQRATAENIEPHKKAVALQTEVHNPLAAAPMESDLRIQQIEDLGPPRRSSSGRVAPITSIFR
jgi:hypothetical protein